MAPDTSTDTTAVVHPATVAGRSRLRHRRGFSWLTFTLLAGVMASAGLDGLDIADVWGVDDATVVAVGDDGTRLEVRHPTVTRPALASPFEITVVRPAGFDADVEIAVDLDYLALWDLNGMHPSPTEERSEGDRVVWTFATPEGDTLRVVVDARIEPGAQLDTRRGAVWLLEPGGARLAARFVTKVRP